MSGSWRVERASGSADDFHARPLAAPVDRAVHVWEVDHPTLVLGSAQRDDAVDLEACASAGVEVVRRRSGGGAVLLDPGATVWIDVELPRHDRLWHDDIGRAAWWLGERWSVALAAVGVAEPTVHRGGLVATEWSPLVCFAGLGPGEVTSRARKVLGISQRRTRDGARFQCAVPLRWDAVRLVGLLALGDAERARCLAATAGAAVGVGGRGEGLVEAFLAALAAGSPAG